VRDASAPGPARVRWQACRNAKRHAAASVPIPKFASLSGTLLLRISESKDTSNLLVQGVYS